MMTSASLMDQQLYRRWVPRFSCYLTVERKEAGAQADSVGIRHDSLVLLFAGKFIPKKQPMDAIRAIEAAAVTNPNLHLLMVGAGPLRAECEAYCIGTRQAVQRFAA